MMAYRRDGLSAEGKNVVTNDHQAVRVSSIVRNASLGSNEEVFGAGTHQTAREGACAPQDIGLNFVGKVFVARTRQNAREAHALLIR